jgi:hypothetical protein
MKDLDQFADDELLRALSLSWRDLSKIVPWGDTFEGVSQANLNVQVERNYLWADEPGGDILCEVAVYLDAAHYPYASRVSRRIKKGAAGAKQKS